MARNYKFPAPATCKLKDGAVLCVAERILALYNQATGKDQKRITDPVKQWFLAQLPAHGWAGGYFLSEVQTGYGAGCIFFVPPQQVNVSVEVTQNMLILKADD